MPPDAALLAGAAQSKPTAELTDVVDELREFARGIHPAILAKGGLRPALLLALARRSSTRVDLAVRIDGRLPEPVEEAAYYVVSEALTNAARCLPDAFSRARRGRGDWPTPARRACGCASTTTGAAALDFTRGSGLVGLKDPSEALGGRISVQSPVGGGTRLDATLRYGPTSAGAE